MAPANQHLEIKKPNVAPGTYADYDRVTMAIADHTIGTRKLRELRTSDLDAYYADLATNRLGPARTCLSPRRVSWRGTAPRPLLLEPHARGGRPDDVR